MILRAAYRDCQDFSAHEVRQLTKQALPARLWPDEDGNLPELKLSFLNHGEVLNRQFPHHALPPQVTSEAALPPKSLFPAHAHGAQPAAHHVSGKAALAHLLE